MKKIKFLSAFAFSIVVILFSQNAFSQGENNADLRAYYDKLRVIENSTLPAKLNDALKDLVPTKEAYEALRKRIERLPDDRNLLKAPYREHSVIILIDAFQDFASNADTPLLAETLRWANLSRMDSLVEKSLLDTILALKGISQPRSLPTINSVFKKNPAANLPAVIDPAKKEELHRDALRQVDEFYEFMKESVVGQDDILRSMQSLFIRDILNGGRTEPEVFYFMGLPGNGKDTIAEAYTDALWKKKGAYQDHMFRMNIRNKEEAWSYFGSAKGYVGSADLPDLLKFLVKHSQGRYVLVMEETQQGKRVVIAKNPAWTQAETISFSPPSKAVIFVNEAHNIPKSVKDNVLKQAIEKGIFPINNPGSSLHAVSHIEVPVTFIFASNEGIDLLEPREKNGARMGAPLTYDRLIENYDRVYHDKAKLKQAILGGNGEKNNPSHPDQPGTSEEFLNRFDDDRVHILRPLSAENLFLIAKMLVKSEAAKLAKASGNFGHFNIELSDDLLRFIVGYDAIPSENSRPIRGRLKSIVFNQINRSLREQSIKPLGVGQNFVIDLLQNADGSKSVIFKVTGPETYEFSKVIPQTLKDIPAQPLSQERIDEIVAMRQQILDNVFGVEYIVDRLIESAIVSESEARNAGVSKRPATIMAFLGKTSTGKTETAKQYVKARYGANEKLEIIDFNGIRSLQAMDAKILGTFDSRNNPIASDFMKAYDRAPDGNIAFIFDEAANSPKELLKALYEILREPIATGFSDGKPRPMKNVTIILTGNAGERIYDAIPKNLPSEVRERALHEVFRLFLNNPDQQQRILAETFPEALIARLGNNIYHFGPLKNGGKRQVAQLKFLAGLQNLLPKNSERGWKIKFSKEQDILDIFDLIEKEGFNSAHQGASIDAFVRLAIIDKIKAALLIAGVPSGQEILLEVDKKTLTRSDKDEAYLSRTLRLTDAFGKEYLIEVPVGKKMESIARQKSETILVAYHEAGHEIVSEFYFGDRIRPKYLSIIQGVALIGASFIHYSGIRSGERLANSPLTKQVVLREAAVLAGGYVAEQMITLGGRHNAGKSNDLDRSTQLIQNAILRFGLSDEWGKRAVSDSMSTEDYIDKVLSQEQKEKLNRITDRWMNEAEVLAEEAIYMNINQLFAGLGKAIAEQGYLNKEDIARLYEISPSVTERSGDIYEDRLQQVRDVIKSVDSAFVKSGEMFKQKFTAKTYTRNDAASAYNFLMRDSKSFLANLVTYFKSPWSQLSELQKAVVTSYIANKIPDSSRDAKIAGRYWIPKHVADIDKLIKEERERQTRPVTDLSKFPILTTTAILAAPGGSCKGLFLIPN